MIFGIWHCFFQFWCPFQVFIIFLLHIHVLLMLIYLASHFPFVQQCCWYRYSKTKVTKLYTYLMDFIAEIWKSVVSIRTLLYLNLKFPRKFIRYKLSLIIMTHLYSSVFLIFTLCAHKEFSQNMYHCSRIVVYLIGP